jgi:hypothetical protein
VGSHINAAEVGSFVRRYSTALNWIVFIVVGFLLIHDSLTSVAHVVWASLLVGGLLSAIKVLESAGAPPRM